jgi:hypothetical protein
MGDILSPGLLAIDPRRGLSKGAALERHRFRQPPHIRPSTANTGSPAAVAASCNASQPAGSTLRAGETLAELRNVVDLVKIAVYRSGHDQSSARSDCHQTVTAQSRYRSVLWK